MEAPYRIWPDRDKRWARQLTAESETFTIFIADERLDPRMTQIPGPAENSIREIQRAISRPEGTLRFRYRSDQIFDPNAGEGRVMEVGAGPGDENGEPRV